MKYTSTLKKFPWFICAIIVSVSGNTYASQDADTMAAIHTKLTALEARGDSGMLYHAKNADRNKNTRWEYGRNIGDSITCEPAAGTCTINEAGVYQSSLVAVNHYGSHAHCQLDLTINDERRIFGENSGYAGGMAKGSYITKLSHGLLHLKAGDTIGARSFHTRTVCYLPLARLVVIRLK